MEIRRIFDGNFRRGLSWCWAMSFYVTNCCYLKRWQHAGRVSLGNLLHTDHMNPATPNRHYRMIHKNSMDHTILAYGVKELRVKCLFWNSNFNFKFEISSHFLRQLKFVNPSNRFFDKYFNQWKFAYMIALFSLAKIYW